EKDYPQGSGIFELRRKSPRGWHLENASGGTCALDSTINHSGKSAVRILPASENTILSTDEIAFGNELKQIDATVWCNGARAVAAYVRWTGRRGVLKIDSLRGIPGQTDSWRKFQIIGAKPPVSAEWLKLVCVTEKGNQPAWWDGAAIVGNLQQERQLRVLVNQLGYEINAPKWFTVQSNFKAASAKFELLTEGGEVAHTAELSFDGRIKGAFGHDWGYYYWRGEFSTIEKFGKYRIRVTLDGCPDISWAFDIGKNLFWERTSRPAYRFFYYQRCGTAIPGFHKACHLDDAANETHSKQFNLAGGWHDAGDYNKYHNAPYVLGLATAYGCQKQLFDQQDEDRNSFSDFFDEILWGADFSRRMIRSDGSVPGPLTSGWGFFGAPEQETDNIPGTGDERILKDRESGGNSSVHTAAMAKIARYHPENKKYIDAAKRGMAWARKNNVRNPYQLSAAIDLYLATGEETYARLAQQLCTEIGMNDLRLAAEFDLAFNRNHRDEIRQRLIDKAEQMLSWAENPFGVYTYGPKNNPNFFGTPASEHKFELGSNSHLLQAAAEMALAYQYKPDARYLKFIYDQFNWIFGVNPYDISMMEGIGSANPPTYHHRYILAGVPRGAVPGSVVNGILWRAIGDDRPRFDLSGVDIPHYASNECWLPHNTNYLLALVHLQTIHQKRF
ncbi:glycoside hydrolase family 9 protein, partial [candidate division KSB1 bacterium]|nr:glycoside hydrolase family 9 protein [candidate division KSB1 bacterium]